MPAPPIRDVFVRTQQPMATGAPSQTSTIPYHTIPYGYYMYTTPRPVSSVSGFGFGFGSMPRIFNFRAHQCRPTRIVRHTSSHALYMLSLSVVGVEVPEALDCRRVVVVDDGLRKRLVGRTCSKQRQHVGMLASTQRAAWWVYSVPDRFCRHTL